MRCKPFPRRGQLSHLARGFRVYTLGLLDASGREWQAGDKRAGTAARGPHTRGFSCSATPAAPLRATGLICLTQQGWFVCGQPLAVQEQRLPRLRAPRHHPCTATWALWPRRNRRLPPCTARLAPAVGSAVGS